MHRTASHAVILLFFVHLGIMGCTSKPSTVVNSSVKTDDGTPISLPREIVGKWRLAVMENSSSRTSVYHFKNDGHVEVDIRVDLPDRKITEIVKRQVIHVRKDQITWVDLSRTGPDGVEEMLPPERRRNRTLQFEVKGEELQLTDVTEGRNLDAGSRPFVLKRVKE